MPSAPLVVSVARTPGELQQARALRYEIYRSQGMIGARPEAVETDAWDRGSTTLVAHRFDDETGEGVLMGAIRVCGSVDGAFPLEAHGFRVPDWIPREGVRETSRWVARPWRRAHTALGLTIAVDHWLRSRGLTHSISVVVPASLRALQRGPWDILPIGPVGTVTLEGGKPLTVVPICMPVLAEPPEPPEGVRIVLEAAAPLVGA